MNPTSLDSWIKVLLSTIRVENNTSPILVVLLIKKHWGLYQSKAIQKWTNI